MPAHITIPAQQPFISTLASHLLHANRHLLPDLQSVQICLPNALAARQLRRALLQQGRQALIGLNISSLSQWINRHVPLPDVQLVQIDQPGRQLILFEALKQHPQLFNSPNADDNNLWQICNSLLQFFDELSQNNFELEACSEDQWQAQLQHAYGIGANNNRDMNHLFYEARLIYTLWQAWQQQIRAMNRVDANTAYQLRLQQKPDQLIAGMTFYVAGFEQLSKAEQQWCRQLETRRQIIYIAQTDDPSDNAYSHFIQQALDASHTLREHIDTHQPPLNLNNRLTLFAASGAEQEARAIHMQTRCWLAENKTSIAIISENRKLMRRVRALMERSNIVVEDTAGWSIATTSAAACLERWLQCMEQDFAWQPLLDLLKSPFFADAGERSEHLKHVFRLEQDIIVYERITADLQRYKKALQQRHTRLPHWHDETRATLHALLDKLDTASVALRKLCTGRKQLAAGDYIETLLVSLDALAITPRLEQDAAGQIVLQEIKKMKLAATHISCKMNWHDFRTWLGATLEQQPFTPRNKPSTVHLLNLKQAEYCEFDAVILASANADSLPGKPVQTPFFNQSVRRALGLKTWTDEKAERFMRFRHLIQAAPCTLASYQAEQDGEWLQPSAWIQSLADYARLTSGTDLHSTVLHTQLETEASRASAIPAELPVQTQPSPSVATTLAPQRWSVSSYQRMVDCPYRFFAADVLALRAEEQIAHELLRAEYGEKIHETLRAFFEQRPHLPAPFSRQVTTANKQQAVEHLIGLARQIFSRDIENNVQHQGWLQQWSATAAGFIDWLIERQTGWQFAQAEVSVQRDIDEFTKLHGRLDLVEKNNEGLAIIDYKSGSSPKTKEVENGENVQLTAYALLMDNVKQVGFLKLDKKDTRFSAEISNEDLDNLAAMNLTRLTELNQNLRNGQGLTAWGDSKTCQFCDMAGLCRKQIWQAASA